MIIKHFFMIKIFIIINGIQLYNIVISLNRYYIFSTFWKNNVNKIFIDFIYLNNHYYKILFMKI